MTVAITGLGTISAAGKNVAESLANLKSSKSNIALIDGIDHMRKPFLGGQVKINDAQLKSALGINDLERVPRSTLLSLTAAKEAWADQCINSEIRTGIISATSIGGMEMSEQFYFDYSQKNDLTKIQNLSVHDNGAGTSILAKYFNIDSFQFTISTACSSAANAILLGSRLIKAGVLDRVLVGGGDALSNFTLNGFDSLMIYDTEFCKPFDDNRNGLNLGEGAGFLVLENERSLAITKSTVLAQVKGWANANDSFHQTASSPDGHGATLAIKKALQLAGLLPEQIDYINAHGTATPNNDLSESVALKNIFEKNVPAFSSTKSYTGHTLAAAGGIEAVFSILALRESLLLPNLNFTTPMKETGLIPVTQIAEKKLNYILSNSFGFGGNSTSLILAS
jgi:3-oxoacyl-[acyl-carrier-protein] synthase-1